jgi:hypothetical protein
MTIQAIHNQPQITQAPKNEAKPANNTGISFGSVFEGIKKNLDGIILVAGNNKAFDMEWKKEKLEVEKARQFKTELEEAQEILARIEKLMNKEEKNS